MKIYVCICFLSTMLSFAQLSKIDPRQEGVSTERIERISELSEAYLNDEKVAGIVTMVSRNGKIIYSKAFGKKRDR